MKLVTVAEMQAVEREANANGLTYELMMENAGRGLADVVMRFYGAEKSGGAFGLVGSGITAAILWSLWHSWPSKAGRRQRISCAPSSR
jgi:hypothetical protein